MMDNTVLRVKRIYADAILPRYATRGSACFDICAYAGVSAPDLRAWDAASVARTLVPFLDSGERRRYYMIPPRHRALVPTGIKFDILKFYEREPTTARMASVRIHARSGLSTKGGVALVNGVGVIDCDYADEVFIPIHNISDAYIRIGHGDRIVQGEVVQNNRFEIVETMEEVQKSSERNGGFGSTGV